jgi:Ca2+-binding EF-hand superfamily protein
MGGNGLKGISRVFKKWDFVGARKLSPNDLKQGLHDHGCMLTDKQINKVVDMWDSHGHGFLSYDDFLVGIKGNLNTSRKVHVDRAYGLLDTDGNGTITLEEIKGIYNAKGHKDVKAGKKTEDEVLLDVMAVFEGPKGNHDGLITREEFEEYYKNLSANIDSDRKFAAMMESAWSTNKYKKGERVGSSRAGSARKSARGSSNSGKNGPKR